ncbi:MAG: shikimate dehydrogenase [Rhodocyclaceae bacterium]|nr:MAG: shikimate dehydrogenase [Rhodocyclaceae bacterium]
MTDKYVVFGNPVAHSKSPRIQMLFAQQTGQDMVYTHRLAPLDGFTPEVHALRAEGGRGANVTVPFKEEAYRLCTRLTPRAQVAEAVNTLVFNGDEILGDNTDGAGLLADIERDPGFTVTAKRVLLIGAGGASRGVIQPLLERQPACLVVANRTAEKAQALADTFGNAVSGCGFAELAGQHFDVIINATSTGLSNDELPLPPGLFAAGCLAYDMMYGKETPFLRQARAAGAKCMDGLGMLVEQAAESFALWRGVRPETDSVLATVRND